jgi:TolC family type I secretion outer membrane protein
MLRGLVLALFTLAVTSGATCASNTECVVLDLASASRMAMQKNPQLAGAYASADVIRASIDRAKSAGMPTLYLESNYAYVNEATFFGTTPVLENSTLDNRIGVQQLIYSGGKVQAGVSQAKHGYSAARESAAAAGEDVVTRVAEAYFRARQAREGIATAQSSVKSLESSREDAQKLHDAGVVTKSDVLRAEVALTTAKEGLIDANNRFNLALAWLKTSIGLPQNAQIDIPQAPCDVVPSLPTLSSENRAEIRAAQARVKVAEASKRAAQAGNLPTVALAANFLNEPAGSQFPRKSNTVMAGVVVKFNVFDGGLTSADIDGADAAIRRAQQNLISTMQSVELQVETARLNLDSAQAKVTTTETQIQSAEESLRTLNVGYTEGITPLTDVLTAESALTQTRFSRLAALYDVKIAEVKLLRAVGQTQMLVAQVN